MSAILNAAGGAALVDLNLDGRLDLVVINRRANMEIHQNVTSEAGTWIGLSVKQPAPNPDAIAHGLKSIPATGLLHAKLQLVVVMQAAR